MLDDSNSKPVRSMQGDSLDDCKLKLDNLYGEGNYEILSKKPVLKGGFLGIFGQKSSYEVQYAVSPKKKNTLVYPKRSEVNPYQNPAFEVIKDEKKSSSDSSDFLAEKNKFLSNFAQGSSSITSLAQNAQMMKELKEIKEKLNDLNTLNSENELHPNIVKIEKLLEDNEFTPSYIRRIRSQINKNFSLEELDDYELLEENVIDWIVEDIHVDKNYDKSTPRAIAVIGPTGVGKTTTIAKLAAEEIKIRKNNDEPSPKLRLVSTDNMRVGASKQLEDWGAAMDVPVYKANNNEDLLQIIREFKALKGDYLYIDTSGFSPTDFENLSRQRQKLEISGIKLDFYLALSAVTKAKDLDSVLRNFEIFNYRSVIVTKLDETSCSGSIISVLAEKNKSIALITDGQNIFNTMHKGDPLILLHRLEGFNIDFDRIKEKFGI